MDVSGVEWQQKVVSARDIARTLRKPIVAMLDNGNYGTGENVDTTDVFLLHSRHCSTRVTAANIKWDGERYVDQGPSLAVPLAYAGWFEILPYDPTGYPQSSNRPGPYFTIHDVSTVGVTSFLSVQDIMCFQLPPSNLMGVYMKQLFSAGEVFVVQGIYVETLKKPSLFTSCVERMRKRPSSSSIKYLQCQSCFGRELLIPMQTKGIFWPLGDPGDVMKIGYVYQMQHIVETLRESPGLHVRLIHGDPPPSLPSDQFNRVMRLEDVVKQEVIVACTLGQVNPILLEFPLYSSVSFTIAEPSSVNHFREIVEYVSENLEDYLGNIKVVKTIQFGSEKFPMANRSLPQAPQISNVIKKWTISPSQINSEFTDYDTITNNDDPIYQNDDSDVFLETARRLRSELTSRKLDGQNSDEGYLSASAVFQRKLARKPLPRKLNETNVPNHQKSFLVTSLNELKGKNLEHLKKQDFENRQEVDDYLENMFDCDILSTSTNSGAMMVAKDEEANNGSEMSDSNINRCIHDEESSLSSLYNKVKSTPNIKHIFSQPSSEAPAPRYHSICNLNPHRGLLATGSDITQVTSSSWLPPRDVHVMSVEDVARSMTFIGMRPVIVERFMEEQIDGHQFKELEEELLREGFPEMNALDRKKVLDFKAGWRPKRESFV